MAKRRNKNPMKSMTIDGQEIGQIEVDNPLASASAPAEGLRVRAMRSLRNDQLAWLHHRGYLDEHLYRAGRGFQALHEAAEVGGFGCQDPGREPIDSGVTTPEVMTDRQFKALKGLSRLKAALGPRGAEILEGVLVDQMSYEQVALRWYGRADRVTKVYVRQRFKECLGTAAERFGYGA